MKRIPRKLRTAVQALRALVGLGDVALLCGATSVFGGAHMIYPPAAWILLGLGLLFIGARS